MDIIIENKNKTKVIKKTVIGISLLLLLALIVVVVSNDSNATYSINREKILLGEVQRGDFNVLVRGAGLLISREKHAVSAIVAGTVEKVSLLPGAKVKKGDVLVSLVNPELVQQLEETQWEYEAQLAETHANEVLLDSQLLDLKATVLNAKLEYENVKLKYTAQKTLLDNGGPAVSKIEFEMTKLLLQQNLERLEIQRQRYQKMKENLVAQKDAHKARNNKINKTLQMVEAQVDGLKIKASIDGILQELSLDIGERVVVGSTIAKISQDDKLIAELKVPEFQIQDVELGQSVIIDTRSSKIEGEVIRIDPTVTNGAVIVDVSLKGNFPSEARIDLSVDGIISTSEKKDTLFVKRPRFAQSNAEASVYFVSANGQSASRRQVKFGKASTTLIEVLDGLAVGDNIIVSDPSNWDKHQEILIQ